MCVQLLSCDRLRVQDGAGSGGGGLLEIRDLAELRRMSGTQQKNWIWRRNWRGKWGKTVPGRGRARAKVLTYELV